MLQTARRTLKVVRRLPPSLIMACHEIGKRRTATIDWTRGPCHDRSASNNSEICLRRAFTGKRGEGKGNNSRISPRKTSENVPHKAVGRESRRNSSGDDARILNARLVCQTMVTRCNPPREVIPLTGFPIDWRRTGRQKKPRPGSRGR